MLSTELQSLNELAWSPVERARQIRAARMAVRNEFPEIAGDIDCMLARIALPVWGLQFIAGRWWSILLSALCAYLIARTGEFALSGLFSLPAGPWWHWSLLLGFSSSAFFCAILGLAGVIGMLDRLTRYAVKRAYLTITGAKVDPVLRALQSSVLTLYFAPLITLLAFTAISDNETQRACASRWKTDTLGTHWTLFRCPSSGAKDCEIEIDGSNEPYVAGSRLILPSSNIRTIDFSSSNCVERVAIRDDRTPSKAADHTATAPWLPPTPSVVFTTQVPDHLTVTLVNPEEYKVFNAIAQSIASISKHLDRGVVLTSTDLNVHVAQDPEMISALGRLTDDFENWAKFTHLITSASEQRSLLHELIGNQCINGIRAAGLKGRIGAFFKENQACKAALELQHKSATAHLAAFTECPSPCPFATPEPPLNQLSQCEDSTCAK